MNELAANDPTFTMVARIIVEFETAAKLGARRRSGYLVRWVRLLAEVATAL
jgi:hypothetical protein